MRSTHGTQLQLLVSADARERSAWVLSLASSPSLGFTQSNPTRTHEAFCTLYLVSSLVVQHSPLSQCWDMNCFNGLPIPLSLCLLPFNFLFNIHLPAPPPPQYPHLTSTRRGQVVQAAPCCSRSPKCAAQVRNPLRRDGSSSFPPGLG